MPKMRHNGATLYQVTAGHETRQSTIVAYRQNSIYPSIIQQMQSSHLDISFSILRVLPVTLCCLFALFFGLGRLDTLLLQLFQQLGDMFSDSLVHIVLLCEQLGALEETGHRLGQALVGGEALVTFLLVFILGLGGGGRVFLKCLGSKVESPSFKVGTLDVERVLFSNGTKDLECRDV